MFRAKNPYIKSGFIGFSLPESSNFKIALLLFLLGYRSILHLNLVHDLCESGELLLHELVLRDESLEVERLEFLLTFVLQAQIPVSWQLNNVNLVENSQRVGLLVLCLLLRACFLGG